MNASELAAAEGAPITQVPDSLAGQAWPITRTSRRAPGCGGPAR